MHRTTEPPSARTLLWPTVDYILDNGKNTVEKNNERTNDTKEIE